MDSRSDPGQDHEEEQKRYRIRDVWRLKKSWFWAGAFMTFVIILVASTVLIYLMPKDYTARVRLEIMRDSQPFEVFPESTTKNQRALDGGSEFVRNEVLKISSKESLYGVVRELQLVKKWDEAKSPAEAYKMLLDKLTVEHLSGSSLVDLTVVHSDPQEAADLANSVARSYKVVRTEQEAKRANAALDMLNAQETLQEQKVEDSRQRMIELMEKFDIVDLGIQSNTNPGSDMPDTGSNKIVVDVEAAVARAEAETSSLKTEIDTVLGLNSENRLLWFQLNDRLTPFGASVVDEWGKLQLKLSMVTVPEAGDVPTEAQTQIGDLRRQVEVLGSIVDRIEADHTAMLRTELEIAMVNLQQLQEIAETKRDDSMAERKSYTQYVEAKRAFEIQSEVLHDMRMSLLREKVDLSLPRQPIEIYEVAEATEEPAAETIQKELKTAAITGAFWAIPGGLVCMYLAFGFSVPREYEYVYEIVDEGGVPEAVEMADEESSPY